MNRLSQRITKLEFRVAQTSVSWSWMDDFNRVDQHAQKKLSVADRAMFSEVWAMRSSQCEPAFTEQQRAVWTRYEEAFAQSVTELQRPNMYLADLWL